MDESEASWLASLRPSRIREVQAGSLAWSTVDLVHVGNGSAWTIRAALEDFGLQVRHFEIGQARHLVAALGGEVTASFLVLACHGDEGRLLLPELAPELERYQPFHRAVGPEELRTFVRLPGSVVIATGCDTGSEALAEAFFDRGASAYVAPAGAPFGYASTFAPIFLFYELVERRSLEEAVAKLQSHDSELAMWQLFRPL